VRPTADRVRESLFARLGDLSGCRVLDAFAGTGALGIEALSRGALEAVFVEQSAAVLAVLTANLGSLELSHASRVIRGDARSALRRLARSGERFDRIFLDPPYGSEILAEVLDQSAGLLAAGGLVVLESARQDPLPSTARLVILDARRYGDTVVTRLAASQAGAAGAADESGGAEGPTPEPGSQHPMSHPGGAARVALFPASFDPVTNGHLDVIHRALKVFDRLVVAIAHNVAKSGTFSVEERLDILRVVLAGEPRVEITAFEGLLVEFCREAGASTIIRGLRAMSDYEYEFEMALMNKHLNPEVETLFMMTSQEYLYVSSSRLKELVRFGGDVSDFVPPLVEKRLREKLQPR
jgi:pantetheine-phosphate adenylyltransferase